ncbi:hypothetical protein R1sor_001141 [Riccia sorocarpa]|uniref:3'(2'),5'-bisphosphate nucleotidase n=1 Tax=Riccia sorocarpa TaxID=122646 RepID=A0ABD3H151_9MARC
MAGSAACSRLSGLYSLQGSSSLRLWRARNHGDKGPRLTIQRQPPSAFPSCGFCSPAHFHKPRPASRRKQWVSPTIVSSSRKSIPRRVLVLRSACDSPELAVVSSQDTAVFKEGVSQQENLLWMCGEEQVSQERSLSRENVSDSLADEAVSAASSGESTNKDLSESRVAEVSSSNEESNSGENVNAVTGTPKYGTESYRRLEVDHFSSKSQNNAQINPSLLMREVSPLSFGGLRSSKYQKELEAAVSAVQLSCILSQSIQERLLRNEENTDFKKDRSVVTVADWGVQAVVSWVLSQAFNDQEIPMMAEEDTTGLRGMEKIDLLQRVVAAVNDCLQHAKKLGINPPPGPLGAIDVLKAINKGSAEGGPKGRYWVLDPVDGTLGFVRGDQYAVALALIEDGEVVLAVLGCPNFPLRKQWLVYHHRYYRIASRLNPPEPNKWHKGLILTTTKGAGEVMMLPLVLNSDGSPLWNESRQMAKPISVSTIDDPVEATFCEPFEKANSSHSFTAGLAEHLGLRNRPLRVYSMAKYAAIARGDAEIFMKFAKAGYREKIWDHAAGVLIVQEAGGVVTDAGGKPLDFSRGRYLENLDRGIIACAGNALHDKLLKAVDASWNSSKL